ncbi:DUF805 domain-containing protein [Alteromonas sp. ASW11-36]|uniref:DUF805 domain-containing protein n=1 Tax=Alteromonas arenosi TaxID=3055817 RepID=A0ABT7SSS8_9ALTE|nr:DUF805 domain-containing protein [Alteromonas sp. ASW11-36]MDM7859255.1 DUF805 domain-containing protein [Alteromonas sp. ASW11-36]
MMYVNSNRLRELRLARQWSQDQLAELSGLNLRTIQRLESGANISSESLRALSAVFEVPAESLLAREPKPSQVALNSMREGVISGLDFSGTTKREDFWWFTLSVAMLLGFAKLLSEVMGTLPLQIATLAVLLPWVAACTRRLRDAGLSPWWQLVIFAPVAGLLVLLYLLAYPSKGAESVDSTRR